MDLINRINHTRFLGREFLTWLWFRSDRQEGLFTVDDAALEVWFDARITLEAAGDIKEQSVIKSEAPTETDEAHASLMSGKLVTDARLRVIRDQKQWTLNFKGEELALGGIKIPALLTREEDDQIYERFALLEEIEDLMDALFKTFIEIRLADESWRAEVEAMRGWVEGMAK